MEKNPDENGNITLVQGDTFSFNVTNVPTDQNYIICFAIQDKNRKFIGNQLLINSNGSSIVPIKLTGDLTDLLTVPLEEEYEIYYYGVKKCSEADNTEETFRIAGGEIGTKNTIKVYPKKVEGI